MANQCGWSTAFLAGWGHELEDWNSKESPMDLNNNKKGRDCEDEIKDECDKKKDKPKTCDECCREKLKKGELTVLEPEPMIPGTGSYR